MESLRKTPQVHLLGKIQSASSFPTDSLYVKYSFKHGENWTLIQGFPSGETFQSSASYKSLIALEHPFDLNYSTKSIRGWPKLLLEVWQVDEAGRNSISGYGQMTIPIEPGEYKIDVVCWRPKAGIWDRMIGAYPELLYKDVIISSNSRFGFKTETTGKITVEISVLLKDFMNHGVRLQGKDGEEIEA